MVGQVTHKNCREEFTNKKDIALHLKRKSANLTPKKTKKIFNHFVLRKMNPKGRKWLKKCKNVLTE